VLAALLATMNPTALANASTFSILCLGLVCLNVKTILKEVFLNNFICDYFLYFLKGA
jgi:hypothetical protein